MPDPLKEPKEVVHGLVEEVHELVEEAERGRSPRTPLIALSGITLLVGAAAAIVIMILFLVYYLV